MHRSQVPARIDRPRQAGFSMAEVLVAVALLSVILLAVFGLVTAGVNRAYGGRKMTEASSLANGILERIDVPGPQSAFGVTGTSTAAVSRTWQKTSPVAGGVSPAAETSSDPANYAERNIWRDMLVNSGLPGSTDHPTELVVSMTPLPTGSSWDTSLSVRIVVTVTWYEWGTRQRVVRLQSLNVRSANL